MDCESCRELALMQVEKARKNIEMELWNKIQTEQRKKEEAKAKVEQMNKAKEIRKEAEQC